MKTKLIIFSIIFSVILPNCKKDKECAAFEVADLQYIAYNRLDTLVFTNSDLDTFIIFVKDFVFSQAYNFECQSLDGVCPCSNYVEVNALNTGSSTAYVFLKMEQSDVSDMQNFKYKVLDFYLEIDFDTELQYSDQIPYLDVVNNYTIGDKTFNNVAVYSNLEDEVSQVSKVYLTKNEGILKIVLKSGKDWTIVI